VSEQAPVALGYPFFENFENGLSRWLPGNWGLNSFQPYSGTNSPHNRVADIWWSTTGLGYANMLLTTAGEIDLTNAINPQLVFWWRGTVNPYTSGAFWVQAYTAGQVWQTIWGNDVAGYNGTYDWTPAAGVADELRHPEDSASAVFRRRPGRVSGQPGGGGVAGGGDAQCAGAAFQDGGFELDAHGFEQRVPAL